MKEDRTRKGNTGKKATTTHKAAGRPQGKAERLLKPVEEKQNTIKLKKREFFMLLFFSTALLFMLYRVGYIQFVKGEEYQNQAYEYQTLKRPVNPKRGTIYDRNGEGLAISASVDTISVNPKAFRDELGSDQTKMAAIANDLAALIDMPAEDILKKFNANSRFEFIKKKVDRETIGSKVRAYRVDKGLINLTVDEDSKRFYPKGSLASHVLGFTGDDDQGLSGIELVLDSTLKGVAGKIMNEADVLGRQISFSKERYVEAIDGYDVTLTLDGTIQHFMEKTLEQASLDYNLKNGATGIAMDPNTGEILAMASYPDFDSNDPDARPDIIPADQEWGGFNDEEDSKLLWQTVFRNKAVMDTYEPGSTFKAITAAAALEEGIVSLNTPVVCKPVSLAGHTINCWKLGGHGAEDFLHAVYNSCNPVFVDISLDLGIQKFYSYVKMFGFMEKTGIEVQGEPSTEVYRKLWHSDPGEIDMAVSSFGQRFQISPIQLIAAYGAIANGGNLMKPTIIKQINDSQGNIIKKFEPQVVRKVISEQTSQTLLEILEGVVSVGTGKNAYISGYHIAGKTGTSETLTTETEGRYIVSFSAIAPADDPKICVLIALDFPQVEMNRRSGGILAAPVAGKLVEEILEYMQVEREYTEKDKQNLTQEVFVPDVTGLTIKQAEEKLKAFGLNYKIEGSNNGEDAVVYAQTPKPDFSVPQSASVILYTDENTTETIVKMPDVLNKTVDEAMAALKALGLNMRVQGSGHAQKQEYEVGTELVKGQIVEVSFIEQVGD